MSEVLELPIRTVLVRTPDGGLRPSGPAYPFIEIMNRRKRPYDRLVLAVLALRKDEDCIKANLYVARRREHDDDKILRLYSGLEEGERLWDSGFARVVFGSDLGAVPAARPYLETILELGECLERLDVTDEAREHYEHLLELDPQHGLGAQAHLDALDQGWSLAMPNVGDAVSEKLGNGRSHCKGSEPRAGKSWKLRLSLPN